VVLPAAAAAVQTEVVIGRAACSDRGQRWLPTTAGRSMSPQQQQPVVAQSSSRTVSRMAQAVHTHTRAPNACRRPPVDESSRDQVLPSSLTSSLSSPRELKDGRLALAADLDAALMLP